MIIGRMEYYKGRARAAAEIDDLAAMQAILRDVFEGILDRRKRSGGIPMVGKGVLIAPRGITARF